MFRPYEPFLELGNITAEVLLGEAEQFFNLFPNTHIKTRFGVASKDHLQQWVKENREQPMFTQDEIKDIIVDPDVDLIWVKRALRGKFDELDKQLARGVRDYLEVLLANFPVSDDFRAKPILGFCGSLAAMLTLENLGLAVPVHGPFGMMNQVSPNLAQRIRDVALSWKTNTSVNAGKLFWMNETARQTSTVEGYVYGGIVQILEEAFRSGNAKLEHGILFLEMPDSPEILEASQRLVQMAFAGRFSVKAFILGDVGRLVGEQKSLFEQLFTELDNHKIPVFGGLSVGHLGFGDNIPVPFGWATLTVGPESSTFLYDYHRTQGIMKDRRTRSTSFS